MNLAYYFIRKKRLASFLFIHGLYTGLYTVYTRFIHGLYTVYTQVYTRFIHRLIHRLIHGLYTGLYTVYTTYQSLSVATPRVTGLNDSTHPD